MDALKTVGINYTGVGTCVIKAAITCVKNLGRNQVDHSRMYTGTDVEFLCCLYALKYIIASNNFLISPKLISAQSSPLLKKRSTKN